ncbi:MAG: hypothetical protein WCV86_04235 [Patescibacteria group bacterium]|jgi:hypothetical protein
MPDINLTPEGSSSEKRKNAKRKNFEYTDPEKEKQRKDERKAPGGLRVWMKSLLRRTPPGKRSDDAMPESLTPPEFNTTKHDENVEDIFGTVDVPAKERAKAKEQKQEVPNTPKAPKLKKLPEKKEEKKKEERRIDGMNLLPEEFSTKIDFRGRGILLSLVLGATVVFIALAYGGLIIYENVIANRTREATDTRIAIQRDIEALESEQLASIAFREKLDLAEALLNQHVYWTKFFALLEKYTIDDVYFSGSLLLSEPGTFTLSGIGRDYTSVVRQLLAFRQAIQSQEFISSVKINGAQQTQDSSGAIATTFTAELTLLPNVNTYTAEEYLTKPSVISIPQSSNTNSNTVDSDNRPATL